MPSNPATRRCKHINRDESPAVFLQKQLIPAGTNGCLVSKDTNFHAIHPSTTLYFIYKSDNLRKLAYRVLHPENDSSKSLHLKNSCGLAECCNGAHLVRISYSENFNLNHQKHKGTTKINMKEVIKLSSNVFWLADSLGCIDWASSTVHPALVNEDKIYKVQVV